MVSRQELYIRLIQSFGFEPTEGQAIVLNHLSAFLLSNKSNPLYILRGYAGTGKTSLVKTLVRTLPTIGMKYVLLAPTGRAAKRMSEATGKEAKIMLDQFPKLGRQSTLSAPALQGAYYALDGVFRTKLPMENTWYRKAK